MSWVPPSPPKATNFMSLSPPGSLPCLLSDLYAASAPLMVAAAFSKAECIQGILHAVYGYIVVPPSRHPVAVVATTGPLAARSTSLTMGGRPQPAQSL